MTAPVLCQIDDSALGEATGGLSGPVRGALVTLGAIAVPTVTYQLTRGSKDQRDATQLAAGVSLGASMVYALPKLSRYLVRNRF